MEPIKTSKRASKTADVTITPNTGAEVTTADSKPAKRASAARVTATTSTPKAAAPNKTTIAHRHSKLATPVAAPLAAAAAAGATDAKPVVEAAPVVSAISGSAAAAPALTRTHSVTTHKVVQVGRDEVAQLAYQYWEERNYAHGYAEEDWHRAEKALGLS